MLVCEMPYCWGVEEQIRVSGMAERNPLSRGRELERGRSVTATTYPSVAQMRLAGLTPGSGSIVTEAANLSIRAVSYRGPLPLC